MKEIQKTPPSKQPRRILVANASQAASSASAVKVDVVDSGKASPVARAPAPLASTGARVAALTETPTAEILFGTDPFEEDAGGSLSATDPLDGLEIEAGDDDSGEDAGEGEQSNDEDEGVEEVGVLTVAYRKCLRCTHLIPEIKGKLEGAKAFECTAENGNSNCPAAYAKIMIGIPVGRIAQQLIEAEETQDSEKIMGIHAKLSSVSDFQRGKVFEELERLRKKKGDEEE